MSNDRSYEKAVSESEVIVIETTCIFSAPPVMLTPEDSLYMWIYNTIPGNFDYEGKIIVQFTIDEYGKVIAPEIKRSGGSVINSVIKEQVMKLRFDPIMDGSYPARIKYSIPITLGFNH